MRYFWLDSLSWAVSRLGFTGIHRLAQALGVLSFDILRIRRWLILKNLDIAFGESKTPQEKRHIGRQSMANFFATVLEFLAAQTLFPRANVTTLHEENRLDYPGKGAYALCLHMGNWEFLCAWHAQAGIPIHVAVKDIGKGKAAQWVKDLRAKLGFRLLERNGPVPATAQIFHALKNGHVVAVIVDQKRPRGEHVPFFGRQASTNNSLIKLALRKPAPIQPVLIRRLRPGAFQVQYFPPFELELDAQQSLPTTITHNTTRMNQLVEEMIRQNPEEYFWIHNRWDLKKSVA